eukprot:tig00000754_g3892.t1
MKDSALSGRPPKRNSAAVHSSDARSRHVRARPLLRLAIDLDEERPCILPSPSSHHASSDDTSSIPDTAPGSPSPFSAAEVEFDPPQQPQPQPPCASLPDELAQLVFSYLTNGEKCAAMLVCRRWRELLSSPDAPWREASVRIAVGLRRQAPETQRRYGTAPALRQACRSLAQPRFSRLRSLRLAVVFFSLSDFGHAGTPRVASVLRQVLRVCGGGLERLSVDLRLYDPSIRAECRLAVRRRMLEPAARLCPVLASLRCHGAASAAPDVGSLPLSPHLESLAAGTVPISALPRLRAALPRLARVGKVRSRPAPPAGPAVGPAPTAPRQIACSGLAELEALAAVPVAFRKAAVADLAISVGALTPALCEALPRHCPLLRSLFLLLLHPAPPGCAGEAALLRAVCGLPRLRSLAVQRLACLTDAFPLAIAAGAAPSLREADLLECPALSPAALARMRAALAARPRPGPRAPPA